MTNSAHPVRRLISYLIATGPAGDGSWRWRFATTLALIGPGSVPFALILFDVQLYIIEMDFEMTWGAVIAAATSTAIVLARWRPVAASLLVLAAMVAVGLGTNAVPGEPWPVTVPNLFAFMVVLFALGRDRRPWVGTLAWAATIAIGSGVYLLMISDAVTAFRGPVYFPFGTPESGNLYLAAQLGAAAFLLGLTLRIWRHVRQRLAEEEEIAEAERHRRRLLQERTRIARELHDIVAHHMSVIAVQSSTAEYRVPDLDEAAKAEFRSISDQARESLAEMRRLLGVLREEGDASLRAPQPGPESLRGLAEAVNRAGTPVSLEVDLPEELSETLALTVFRVAQEGLSNVVRHAPGAEVAIEAAVRDGRVEVTVANGPPPGYAAEARTQGSGLGLVGMRERVSLDGGTLETGPTPDGGFRVHAVLPIENLSAPEESE
ncbi:sensor histidine kinase [Glycomyces sp. NPDC046736]|uniref:sensor histidine kinase n=1 Tax=Glycomyces sp. NPDC046736 TaxID=3155615 RepID=UPI0033FA507E